MCQGCCFYKLAKKCKSRKEIMISSNKHVIVHIVIGYIQIHNARKVIFQRAVPQKLCSPLEEVGFLDLFLDKI